MPTIELKGVEYSTFFTHSGTVAPEDYIDHGRGSVKWLDGLGDFGIHQSKLEISYKPVPKPGTMLLLGLGLFGIAGIRRKMIKNKLQPARHISELSKYKRQGVFSPLSFHF